MAGFGGRDNTAAKRIRSSYRGSGHSGRRFRGRDPGTYRNDDDRACVAVDLRRGSAVVDDAFDQYLRRLDQWRKDFGDIASDARHSRVDHHDAGWLSDGESGPTRTCAGSWNHGILLWRACLVDFSDDVDRSDRKAVVEARVFRILFVDHDGAGADRHSRQSVAAPSVAVRIPWHSVCYAGIQLGDGRESSDLRLSGNERRL